MEEDKARELTQVIVEKFTGREVRRIVKYMREGFELGPPYPWQVYSNTENGNRGIERALNNCMVALKTCMYRINETIEDVDEWPIKEIL
ncbi:MAG: hypothetical protein ACPLZF_06115 [Nitrososphaeria archaeon]